jgi:hypothetical protein
LILVKRASAAVAVAIGSCILAACSNTSAPRGLVPSGASLHSEGAALRAVVAGVEVPSSSLRFAGDQFRSDVLDVQQMNSAASAQVLYGSLAQSAVFYGYRLPTKKPFCQNQPVNSTLVNSVGTDKAGNLWVPVQVLGSGGEIYSFAPSCGAQGTTLSTPPNASPVGIAFGPDGTKFGLMVYISSSKDSASVSVYPPGATNPTAELTDARLNGPNYDPDGVGTDAAGHVYVTCCGAAQPSRFAIEFTGRGGQRKGKKIVLQQLTFPGGSVTFDRSNNMIVPDLTAATVNVYAPPYTGAPTIHPLKGTPWQCALSRRESMLACANQSANTLDLYAYPALTYRYSLKPGGNPSSPFLGVAFFPSP